MQKSYLNGVLTHSFASRDEVLTYISDKKNILVAINTEKILNEDQKLRNIINENIGYPDGIGAVMALKRKGIAAIKIPGAELWLDIVRAYSRQKSFCLIGAKQGVIESTVAKLKNKYPNIRIVYYRNGYFGEEELADIKANLQHKKPDIVFVALGSPKQEYIMSQLMQTHPALYMGLGGSFDLDSGKAKPVPEWWKNIFKWEGLYRCFNDVTDLKRWKRQIPALRILYMIALNRI